MGEPDLAQQLDVGAAAAAGGGRRPLPHPVHGQQRRLLERRAEERAGRMGQVMLGEENAVARDPDLLGDAPGDPQLVDEPGRHRVLEHPRAARERAHRGRQDALELQERLLEEDDIAEIGCIDAGLGHDVADGVRRELRVMLAAREAFLLGGGHELTIPQQRGGGVVKEAGDAENVHGYACRRAPVSE